MTNSIMYTRYKDEPTPASESIICTLVRPRSFVKPEIRILIDYRNQQRAVKLIKIVFNGSTKMIQWLSHKILKNNVPGA